RWPRAWSSDVCSSDLAPIMPDGEEPPDDAYGQAMRCLEIVLAALSEAGASPEQVVRTRCYLARAEDWREVGRAHGEVFGDIRPEIGRASRRGRGWSGG